MVKSALAEESSTALIPFIFLSALTDLSNIEKGLRNGADDYLTKPYKTKDLLNAVYSRLKKKEKD